MTVEWYNAKVGLPAVSVGPSGITFTPAARMLLCDPASVRVGVDGATKRMYVKATAADDEYAVPFGERLDKNGYVRLSKRDIARFLASRVPGLNLDRAQRYAAVWNHNEACLEVDLADPALPPKSRRGRGARKEAGG